MKRYQRNSNAIVEVDGVEMTRYQRNNKAIYERGQQRKYELMRDLLGETQCLSMVDTNTKVIGIVKGEIDQFLLRDDVKSALESEHYVLHIAVMHGDRTEIEPFNNFFVFPR